MNAGMISDLMMQAAEYRFGTNTTAPIVIERVSDNSCRYTTAETRSFARMLGLKPITTMENHR